MTNPKIDLENVARHLESVGFERRTKTKFRRGFVDIEVVNGIIPDVYMQAPEEAAEPQFCVKFYSDDNALYAQLMLNTLFVMPNTKT